MRLPRLQTLLGELIRATGREWVGVSLELLKGENVAETFQPANSLSELYQLLLERGLLGVAFFELSLSPLECLSLLRLILADLILPREYRCGELVQNIVKMFCVRRLNLFQGKVSF